MSEQKVDVLAVMDRLDDYYRRHEVLIGPVDDAYSVEHRNARAAVAELIEAAKPACSALNTSRLVMQDQDCRDYAGELCARLDAALAHIGGAA